MRERERERMREKDRAPCGLCSPVMPGSLTFQGKERKRGERGKVVGMAAMVCSSTTELMVLGGLVPFSQR